MGSRKPFDGYLTCLCIFASLSLYIITVGFNDSTIFLAQTVLALLCALVATYLEGQCCLKAVSCTFKWKMRQDASCGYSCAVLLPFALLTRGFLKPDNYNIAVSLFTTIILMSTMIVICSIQCMSTKPGRCCHTSESQNVLTSPIFPYPFNLWSPSHLALIFLGLCILYNCGGGWVYFAVVTFCQIFYLCLVSILLAQFPLSFTIGETMVISQGLAMLVFDTACDILKKEKLYVCRFDESVASETGYIVKITFLSILILVSILYSFPCTRMTYGFYILSCLTCGLFTFPVLCYGLHQNVISWSLKYLLIKEKILLILYWAFISIVCIIIVIYMNKSTVAFSKNGKVSTRTRKYFHIAALAIFLPGFLLDPQLLSLASGVALSIMCFLEIIRYLQIKPLGSVLDQALHIFLDDKDQGPLIVTHIYLLAGCCLPLWLYPYPLSLEYGALLPWFAGIISVGVGDTAAAVIGSKYGRHKWPDGQKSIEGTLAAIVIQLAFCLVLSYIGVVPPMSHNCVALFGVVVLTSLMEALTTQIDNLILPLFMYNCLQATFIA